MVSFTFVLIVYAAANFGVTLTFAVLLNELADDHELALSFL